MFGKEVSSASFIPTYLCACLLNGSTGRVEQIHKRFNAMKTQHVYPVNISEFLKELKKQNYDGLCVCSRILVVVSPTAFELTVRT